MTRLELGKEDGIASGTSRRHCPSALNATGCTGWLPSREKSAVGANLRKVFDGMALEGGAHRRTMLGIDRPDMHPVSVILSRRIGQAPAVRAEDDVCDLELSRRECAGRPASRGDGI